MQEIAVNAILTKDEWDTMPGGLFDQVLDCFEIFSGICWTFFDQVHKSLAPLLNLSLNYSYKTKYKYKYKYYSYKSKCKYTGNQESN